MDLVAGKGIERNEAATYTMLLGACNTWRQLPDYRQVNLYSRTTMQLG